jgi:hypothetical protein
MARRAAVSVAMLGMAVSIFVGLASGNPTTVILERAIYTLLICFAVAGLAGLIAQRVVAEHIRHREELVLSTLPPLPPKPTDDEQAAGAAENQDEPFVVGGVELPGR